MKIISKCCFVLLASLVAASCATRSTDPVPAVAVFAQPPSTGVTSATPVLGGVALTWSNGDRFEGGRNGRLSDATWSFADGTRIIYRNASYTLIDAAGVSHSGQWTPPSLISGPNSADFYPNEAARSHQQGDVLVSFVISETGELEDFQLMQSSGIDSLNEASIAAIKVRKYNPGMLDGKAVKMPWHVQLVWRLE